MNLLVVEDEKQVADFIQRGLRAEGWVVSLAFDGETALKLIAEDNFDAVVLDLMLPGISGQEVCRRMRTQNNFTPVLMLSALDQTDDRVSGLQIGADDYLVKPFDFEELIARIEALVRRSRGFPSNDIGHEKHILQHGTIVFNTVSLEITCQDQQITLTEKERRVLQLFLSSPDKIYSRERILNAVWGANEDPLTNVIDVYVGRLRKKLGHAGKAIETIRGAGYKLSTHRMEEIRDTGM
ncbi:MAG: response regulator [Desulfobulbaceae bacterium]|nr:response regulator [Desulfobulbaceae bacterium]